MTASPLKPEQPMDPLEVPGSPEALAQADLVESIFARHERFRGYMPTIASLAAKRSPVSLALAHGRVLRTVYQMDYRGISGADAPHPREVYAYLREVLEYLCERKAGILMRREPIEADAVVLSDPTAPEHLRDARIALTKVMTFTSLDGWTGRMAHEDILDLYLDHGYFSDSPSQRIALPSPPHTTWIEQAIDSCNPFIIGALVRRGVDLDAYLTHEILERKRASLSSVSPDAPDRWYRTPRYRQLEDVQPGDFLGYFKICCFTAALGTWENHPRCVEVVKWLEAAKMSQQIEIASSISAGTAPPPSTAAPTRRRAHL